MGQTKKIINKKASGIALAAISSLTFGLAPYFSVVLLKADFSPFEVLSYRWGCATLLLVVFGLLSGASFKVPKDSILSLLGVSIFRAITSVSLLIAYSNIATGVSSTIHFMYPLLVSIIMMTFFHEKKSATKIGAILVSLVGAALLSLGEIDVEGGNNVVGLVSAAVSVVAYGIYIIGIRKTKVHDIESTPLTCYVMGIGAVCFFVAGMLTGGVRLVPLSDHQLWLNILGLALLGTAISNITLVKAVKQIGPTLSSILGALEPLGAVVIGIIAFGESFTWKTAAGIILIIGSVSVAVLSEHKETEIT